MVGKVPVKLKDDLQTPPKKAGGRKGEQERARLMSVSVGELAQVVTRGRILVLLVGEKEVCFFPTPIGIQLHWTRKESIIMGCLSCPLQHPSPIT